MNFRILTVAGVLALGLAACQQKVEEEAAPPAAEAMAPAAPAADSMAATPPPADAGAMATTPPPADAGAMATTPPPAEGAMPEKK